MIHFYSIFMDYTADRVVDEIKDVFDFKIKENIAKSFVL